MFVPHSDFVKWILVGNVMKWTVYYNNKQQNLETVLKVAPYFSSIKLFSCWLLHSLIWPCRSCCFSVTQLFLTLCDPMDYSTPGFPVLHCLPKFAQLMSIESLMLSNHLILLPSSLFCLQSFPDLSQNQGLFPISWLFTSGGQSIGASASVSILPINIQGWFPWGLTDLISLQSKELSRVFSYTTIQ